MQEVDQFWDRIKEMGVEYGVLDPEPRQPRRTLIADERIAKREWTVGEVLEDVKTHRE